jgi:hypothetical protein
MCVRQSTRWISFCAAILLWHPASAAAQGAQLQLDRLSRLAGQASNVVDVTVDPAMLQLASGFISNEKGNDAAIKYLIANLKGVYVKSFEFDRDGAYTDADVNAIREQLKAPWIRVINVRSKVESSEIYIYREGDKSGGLAIVVAEPRELTVVNIVGPIDLAQLSALGGQLGIPKNLPPAPQ